MARACKVCTHTHRADIEAMILNRETRVSIADKFGLSPAGIARHSANCRVTNMRIVVAARERIDVLANLTLLADDAARAQFAAEREEKWGTVALLIGKRREVLDSIHELQGPEQTDRDFTRDPRWLEAWQRVLGALAAHPDARMAVVRALTPPRSGGDS